MKYRELTPTEIEAYEIGYKVGNRKMVITDIEWESENEHKIYRKGYMAGLMDYKRNVSIVSKVNNVEIETPITSTTPIGISISKGNMDSEESNKGVIGGKEKIPIGKVNFDTPFQAGGQLWELPPQFRKLALTKYTEEEVREFEMTHSCHEEPFTLCLNDIKHKPKTTRFVKPTLEEVEAYCEERQNGIDAVAFYSFYESKGWQIGKNQMKNWKAAIITWERKNYEKPLKQQII